MQVDLTWPVHSGILWVSEISVRPISILQHEGGEGII